MGYWSTIEVPVSVICACMPAIRSLFVRILPSVFGSTARDSPQESFATGFEIKSGRSRTSTMLGMDRRPTWETNGPFGDQKPFVELVDMEAQNANVKE